MMSIVLKHPLEDQVFVVGGIVGLVTGMLAALLHVLEMSALSVNEITLEQVSLRTFLLLCSAAVACLLIANRRSCGAKLRSTLQRWSQSLLKYGASAGYLAAEA